ncbi:hypothetical protein ACFPRL_23250 [Pseudoclavibacter helvolus]
MRKTTRIHDATGVRTHTGQLAQYGPAASLRSRRSSRRRALFAGRGSDPDQYQCASWPRLHLDLARVLTGRSDFSSRSA